MRPETPGLKYYEPGRCHRGYTLFSGGTPASAYVIDMEGRICHRWTNQRGISYGMLLGNGNLLCRASSAENVAGQQGLNGQTPAVFELDWDGNEVWCYEDEWLHHDLERLANGNTLVTQWRPMPKQVSDQVKGGWQRPEDNMMMGDVLMEISPAGGVVREWVSWQHLDPDVDVICPIEHRMEWTHANSVAETADGRWVVSFRRIDTVAIIDPGNGEIVWRWGRGNLSHQHDARILPDGNLTVFDNGAHRAGAAEFSQVLEVDPKSNEVVWRYQADPPFNFFTFMGGSAERLPNGNTLIAQTQAGRLFEVTRSGETVWEFVNPFYAFNARLGGRMNGVFKTHRYAADYPAFAGRNLDPQRFANLNRLYA